MTTGPTRLSASSFRDEPSRTWIARSDIASGTSSSLNARTCRRQTPPPGRFVGLGVGAADTVTVGPPRTIPLPENQSVS
ncbi:hypothetical protein EXE50_06065 [Halorubrum sp. ARQ200]|nr:hypothetical protein EXE50_06065 [Halorubrum sp. ARQ200]